MYVFQLPRYIYLRVISCICVLLVAVMHASVHCVACGSDDVIKYIQISTKTPRAAETM